METVYRNRDERLGENCLFTLPIMRECYRANGWDNGMSDDEIDADILRHDVEEVGGDELEMRRDLDAFGSGRPYTYNHATGHVQWDDGVQTSVWRDEDGMFRAVEIAGR